jgi:type IV secretory pathway ATPase VirB11/archaellum biosynthesis ATPase
MTGLFSKLNKRLPSRTSSSESIPIARVIHNQPIPENASPEELDILVTKPTAPDMTPSEDGSGVEPATERVNPWAPLSTLIADPAVTDLFLLPPEQVSVRRSGIVSPTSTTVSESEFLAIHEDCERQLRVRCKEGNRFVTGALSSPLPGRVSISHPALSGAESFTIHVRLQRISPTFYDLIKAKMLPAPLASWLTELLASRCINVVVCGAPGSGKTTLCSTLCHAAPSEERIIAVEPFPELAPPSRKIERLCSRPSQELPSSATITVWGGLIDVALRSSPDRLFCTELSINSDRLPEQKRALQSCLPTALEFSSAPSETVCEHIRQLGSPLPTVVIDTQLHEHRPIVRSVTEVSTSGVSEIVTFCGLIDGKRTWARSNDQSVVRELLSERGHELKTTAALLDGFPDNE